MNGKSEDIKKNNNILLARNHPVGLAVGAASFFGSHLVDKLLLKNIQVIGVDDLAYGEKENLSQATKSADFHLINTAPENLSLDLERIDYIFIVPIKKLNLKKVLEIFKQYKSRLLFISSIETYRQDLSGSARQLKELESEIAKFAKEHNLNARILRLGPVYGPRMKFESDDPVVKLIQQSLTGDLQKEIDLEFSSRALFIDDAVNLAIKCIFGGATAQKIFDGSLPAPVKVSEIKQILLDPVWYESREFKPSELPPHPTPNLQKTIKFLNWHPQTNLVTNLRETISFFRDNEIRVPKLENRDRKMEDGKEKEEEGESVPSGERWKKEKLEELAGLREDKSKQQEKGRRIKIKYDFSKFLKVLAFIFIGYALIWPLIQVSWGVLFFKLNTQAAIVSLSEGKFDKGLSSAKQAADGAALTRSILLSFQPIQQTGFLKSQFTLADDLTELTTLTSDSTLSTLLGLQSLITSLRAISGELNESSKSYFEVAQINFSKADENIAKALALIDSEDFQINLPKILRKEVDNLAQQLKDLSGLVKQGEFATFLLSEVIAMDGEKQYLILLQNNLEIRPTGGSIGTYGLISFEGGKLKKLETNDTYVIDNMLKIHVEPPREIKEDLGQTAYFLRDSNWEPDFPTAAKLAQWFYNQETGEPVSGVFALDLAAVEDLLSVLGPIDLPEYEEKVDQNNLFEKAIKHSDVNFFQGSRSKKGFLTTLSAALFNKLFFLPHADWQDLIASIAVSLQSKHLSLYLNDPKLFSYLSLQNWAAVFPRGGKETDFLAPVEANLGANKVNFYLDRKYNLETVISKDGGVNHRLKISYINKSPSNAFPGGVYKNRMRVYLPLGSQISRVLWGEDDISGEVSNFVDYGRLGLSFLLELAPKEAKTLILDYQSSFKLQFDEEFSSYRLDVLKQPGTLKDPFNWTLTYPLNMRLVGESSQIGPQQHLVQTDLSKDRTFEKTFLRP